MVVVVCCPQRVLSGYLRFGCIVSHATYFGGLVLRFRGGYGYLHFRRWILMHLRQSGEWLFYAPPQKNWKILGWRRASNANTKTAERLWSASDRRWTAERQGPRYTYVCSIIYSIPGNILYYIGRSLPGTSKYLSSQPVVVRRPYKLFWAHPTSTTYWYVTRADVFRLLCHLFYQLCCAVRSAPV